MKKCNKCKKYKFLEQFIKNKHCKEGVAGTCKKCHNKYIKRWKRKNYKRLAEKRRKRYVETEGLEVKQRQERRKQLFPLRTRCQMLRNGMCCRAKSKKIKFDDKFFTVNYLIKRLTNNPNCECCHKKLDIGFKKDKKFNDNSPSMDRVNSSKGYTKNNVAILCWRCNKHKQDATSKELRQIANFMDTWGDELFKDLKGD